MTALHTRSGATSIASALSTRIGAKVPIVGVVFWAVKLLTTGMGEAISDYLAGVSIVVAGGLGLIGLVIMLGLQIAAREYRAWRYWGTVAMVAVFGTMAADGVHKILGVPYTLTTILYLVAVIGILLVWKLVEGSVSIHTITTRRRELFYWATVLATFALGTAAGDMAAFALGLGYFASILLFAALMIVPLVAWRLRWMGEVAAFWTAYVLTRPLGASIADWLGKPPTKGGGIGWGDDIVSLGALALFLIAALWLTMTRRDAPEPRAA